MSSTTLDTIFNQLREAGEAYLASPEPELINALADKVEAGEELTEEEQATVKEYLSITKGIREHLDAMGKVLRVQQDAEE